MPPDTEIDIPERTGTQDKEKSERVFSPNISAYLELTPWEFRTKREAREPIYDTLALSSGCVTH